MPTVSANLSPKAHEAAKALAAKRNVSLRDLLGTATEEFLEAHRAQMRRGPKLNQPNTVPL